MTSRRILLLFGIPDAEVDTLRELLGEDPTMLLASLGDTGEIPVDLAVSGQVLIMADWAGLSANPSLPDYWREALHPAPVGILVRIERGRLEDALVQMGPRKVDDFIEVPCPSAYLTRKVLTTFRYLTAQQGTRGLRAELEEQTADFTEFHRVALSLAAESNVDRLLELIVEKCREATTADAGSLYLIAEAPAEGSGDGRQSARVLRFIVAQNDSKPFGLKSVTLPLDRSTIAGYVALTRTILNLPDVYVRPANAEFTFNPAMDQRFGYRTVSMLAAPLIDNSGQVIGVVQVINKKRRPTVRLDTPQAAMAEVLPFDSRDEAMVESLASLASVVAVRGRQAEQTRLELERRLRQAQKMDAIGRLAGGVAHDFNDLLTVIAGRSALLLDRLPPDNPLRRHVEFIGHTARRGSELTRQLQALSRDQVLEPRVLDVNESVRAMAPGLRQLLGHHVRLDIVEGALTGLTRADPRQIEQVVMNLAVNARDAMPHGGGLTVETRDVELDEAFVRRHPGAGAGPHVTIAVRDTGVGMADEVQTHLFEPFFTTKEPGKNAGLGLATVYGIVKQHHGHVAVESRLGHGTTFTIYLPRVEAVAPTPVGAPEAPEPAAGSETILVVEDEEAVRELVREILSLSGYTVLEARSGPEALALSERHPGSIHLLLTDVVMPEMTGPALASQLLARYPAVRLLYMSGYATDALGSRGELPSGTALLQKPFSPGSLVKAVREALSPA